MIQTGAQQGRSLHGCGPVTWAAARDRPEGLRFCVRETANPATHPVRTFHREVDQRPARQTVCMGGELLLFK